MPTRTIAHYVYDGAVLIEFAGPLQVFATASRIAAKKGASAVSLFDARLVARSTDAITTREGVVIMPDYTIADHPHLDVILVPGGALQDELNDPEIQRWLRAVAPKAEITGSVCAGSFFLGKAGVLDGLSATTHFEDLNELSAIAPDAKIVADRLWVDEGRVVTAGGFTAGIDMALHLVARMAGDDLAQETARTLEYRMRDVADRAFQV